MAKELPKQTGTLLKHRAKIDEELATRSYLDVELFKQVHSGCGQLSKNRVDWKRVGYNTTWDDYEYAPIKTLSCPKHDVTSSRFTDYDAYNAGEVGTSHS